MKLVRFKTTQSEGPRPGVCRGLTVVSLQDTTVDTFADMLSLSLSAPGKLAKTVDDAEDEGSTFDRLAVDIRPPVETDGRVICLGGVFPSHLHERGSDLNIVPSQWLAPDSALVGPGDPIELTEEVKQDTIPAVELGVVIGKRSRNIRQSLAYDHVAGYTIVNDVTARTDWPGPMAYKLMDTFSPCGPHVVTADTVDDPHDLRMSIHQDGEAICSGTTAGMRYTIPFLVSFVSTIIELRPGDVISTGDPAGVEESLHPGSTVILEIENVGELSNPVRTAGTQRGGDTFS